MFGQTEKNQTPVRNPATSSSFYQHGTERRETRETIPLAFAILAIVLESTHSPTSLHYDFFDNIPG